MCGSCIERRKEEKSSLFICLSCFDISMEKQSDDKSSVPFFAALAALASLVPFAALPSLAALPSFAALAALTAFWLAALR